VNCFCGAAADYIYRDLEGNDLGVCANCHAVDVRFMPSGAARSGSQSCDDMQESGGPKTEGPLPELLFDPESL
jgi:hypothetical protein